MSCSSSSSSSSASSTPNVLASCLAWSAHSRECTAQSIVKALDTFLREVQLMRETVMVPNRLRGLSAGKFELPLQQHISDALLPLGCRALMLVDANHNRVPLLNGAAKNGLFSPGQRQLSVEPGQPSSIINNNNGIGGINGTNGHCLLQKTARGEDVFCLPEDSFTRFRVVYLIQRELFQDASSVEKQSPFDADDSEDEDEQTRLFAARFRQDLRRLFNVLNFLTRVAKDLSKSYNEEVYGKRA